MHGETVGKYYYREGINGSEILLFDPLTFIEDKELSIKSAIPSFDEKKVLIAYSAAGAEVSTIKILDVDTKTFLSETIYPSWFGPLDWTLDSKAFTYFWQKTDDHNDPSFELDTKTKLQHLGDDLSNNIDFFSNESYPNLNIQPNEFPLVQVDKDSPKYIFGYLTNVRREMIVYYADIAELHKKFNWSVLCKEEDVTPFRITMTWC